MNRTVSRSLHEGTLLLWLLPLAIVCISVFVIPVIQIVRWSFSDSTLMKEGHELSLRAYIALLSSNDFMSILRTTLIFVVASVLLQVALGFVIALFLDYGNRRGLRGTIIVRTAVLVSWAIPGVVAGVIWKMMFSEMDSGLITSLAHFIVPTSRPRFLSSPAAALASSVVANVWRGTAYSMILLYAGLMTFPNDLNEASQIDGANAFQRLFQIKIPVLAPLFLICILLVTVQTFNTFDMLMALTGGGPGRGTEVLALYIYKTIFTELNLGRGSAAAMLLLLINVAMTWVYFRFLNIGAA